MSLRLVWRATARTDLRDITAYATDLDAAFARELNDRIRDCAERLTDHPYGHPGGRVRGTREALVHPNYALTYRAGTDVVEILGIVHTCQQFPPEQGSDRIV